MTSKFFPCFKKFIILALGIPLCYGLYVFLASFGSLAVPQGDTAIRGFHKINPLDSTINYKGTNFTVLFTNALGTTIAIDKIRLTELISSYNCTLSPDLTGTKTKAGGTFYITSTDCPAKTESDTYNMEITIQYNATLGGISQNITEIGYIEKR